MPHRSSAGRAALFAFGAALAALPAVSWSQDLKSYLIARTAAGNGHYALAAENYAEAVRADPSNLDLRGKALLIFLVAGEADMAVDAARALESGGRQSLESSLLLIAEDVVGGRFDEALRRHEESSAENAVMGALIPGWLHLGSGNDEAAFEHFASEFEQSAVIVPLARFHGALARASRGEFEAAAAVFAELEPLLHEEEALRQLVADQFYSAYAQSLAKLGDSEGALEVIAGAPKSDWDPGSAALDALGKELAAGGFRRYDAVASSREGVAQALAVVARLLDGSDDQAILVWRLAEILDPDNTVLRMRVAESLSGLGSPALAAEAYGGVSPDDPLHRLASIGRGNALQDAGEPEEAIATLTSLAERHPDSEQVQYSLGNIFRMESRFEEALAAYDAALSINPEPTVENWSTYYFRGIARERTGEWEEAKEDFRIALELSEGRSGRPYVLNYLGYSMLEQHEDYEGAERLIREAVAAEPDNGAFVDSLGWALYLLGRHDEALVEMKKAVKLEPVDPIVIDHLGDVYWAVGMRREADFQWRRALSHEPEEELRARIERKLDIGLDAVLEEESAASAEAGAN